MRSPLNESGLLRQTAAELEFETHRIPIDQTGRYDEPLDREFPFIVKLFHFRERDFTPKLTWHERLELYLPVDAGAKMRMGSQLIELEAGELLIVDHLKLHTTINQPGLDVRVVVLSFLPEFVYSLGSPSHDYSFLLPFYSKPGTAVHVVREHSTVLPEIHFSLVRLLKCYFGRDRYYQAGCKANFLQILYLLTQHFHASKILHSEYLRQQERAGRLKPVFDYISQHFAESISLKKGAQLALMSPPSFVRAFKKVAGMTFVNYVTHVRLSHAMRLLHEDVLSIAEIASQVGFSDQSYFDRRFRLAFGQTPSQARNHSKTD